MRTASTTSSSSTRRRAAPRWILLDAPGRLVRFLDEGVVRWFLDRVPDESELDADDLSAVDRAALRALALVTSRTLVAEMVEFFRLFAPLREGFSTRARETSERLRARDSAFVVVASPSSTHVDDALHVIDGLVERGLAPRAVVVNRAYAPGADGASVPVAPLSGEGVDARLARLFRGSPPEGARALLETMEATRTDAVERYERALDVAATLAPDRSRAVLPELDPAPTSLEALGRLADALRARWQPG